MSSAGWKDIKYRQDLPPPGGYGSVPYKRNLPVRGPSGLVLWGLVLATHAFPYFLLLKKNEFRYLTESENKQALLSLQPLLDAEKDRAMLRYWKENVESEALNIVGTGYDPNYKPGQGDVFEVSERYHSPVKGIKGFWGIDIGDRIRKWYGGVVRVPRCGP